MEKTGTMPPQWASSKHVGMRVRSRRAGPQVGRPECTTIFTTISQKKKTSIIHSNLTYVHKNNPDRTKFNSTGYKVYDGCHAGRLLKAAHQRYSAFSLFPALRGSFA